MCHNHSLVSHLNNKHWTEPRISIHKVTVQNQGTYILYNNTIMALFQCELLVQGEHSNLWSHFAAPEIYAVMITLEIQCGFCRHLKLENPSTDGHFITE